MSKKPNYLARHKASTLFALAIVGLAVALAAIKFSTYAGSIPQYTQGFEVNNIWGDPPTDPTRVASGTNGIPSRTGAFHAQAVAGNFTRWGGYNSTFPANGYTTSVDIYLNMAGGYANDTRFDWSSAINGPTGTFRRDFIFNGGFYNDAGPVGIGPRFCFSASNNTPGDPRNPARSPVSVNTTGWYTLKHTFQSGAGGRLFVKMQLINPAGVPAGVWFLSDPTDIVGSTVGGNRYGFLATSAFPFLAVDNSQRSNFDGVPDTVVINETDISGWVFYDDETDRIDPTLGSFVTGPGTTPLGTGSVQISVTGTQRRNLATYQFAGTPLAAITNLAFSTYNPSAGNPGSPNRSGYLHFNVDFDGSDTFQRRLVYVPSLNGTVMQNTWQEWDAINGGNAMWSYSGPNWPAGVGGGGEPGTTLKTWNQVLSQYPGVRIRVSDAFVGIRVGEPYADGYTENIDEFKFGTAAGMTVFDFDPASMLSVNATAFPTALDNDYTRINDAVQAAAAGSTVMLSGTFNWTEPNAAASWAKGSDGQTGGAFDNDNYCILPPPNRNNVTITAATVGGATIQGPGDVPTFDLEGVFQYFNNGDNQNLTISNLRFLDFDLAIAMFFGAGGSDAYNNAHILNNYILVAKDLNATVAPADIGQNIGIHFAFGTNQIISGNTIELHGDGISAAPNFSTEVGMQSNTSGGSVYDGLQITNNIIRVLNAQDNANPENILGIWENGAAHTSNITVSGNTFSNLAGGNNAAVNQQRAFRVTSHSSPTTTVTYSGNSVSGANIGFQWITGSDFSANMPVKLTSNTLVNNATGVLVQSNGQANLSFNRILGNTASGVQNAAGSTTLAENNWWGCNFGPGIGGAGCTGTPNGTIGTVDTNPWLKLTTTALPTVIGLGEHSTVLSSLRINSDNLVPAGGFIPNGVPVAFAASLGTVNPTSGMTSSGNAGGTTFTASAFGTGGVTTTVDSQFVNAPITITAACTAVSIPATTSQTGVMATTSIMTTDLTGRGAFSADFTVTYDNTVTTAPVVATTALTAGSVLTVNSLTPGVLIISVFNSAPFSGSGAFLDLTFNVVGLPGSVSPLTFTSFRYNEGAPCNTTANGSITVVGGTITGTVNYGNSRAPGPPTRPVSNVTITGTGPTIVSTTTSSTGCPSPPCGTYSLSGFVAGMYTRSASKTGGDNGAITSFDSSKIARHVTGLEPFNNEPAQSTVADVSANGQVTSFDAALIARYVVALPGSGTTGNWIFTPATYGPSTVYVNIAGEDYTALLMGDVTGNWGDPASYMNPPRPYTLTDARGLTIRAARTSVSAGSDVLVPITIRAAAGKEIVSYQFNIRYDKNVIRPAAEPVVVQDTLSGNYVATANPVEPGLLRVSVFGAQPIDGDGTLVNLRFTAVGKPGSSSAISWETMLINEGDPRAAVVDGRIDIAPANDADLTGRVLTSNGDPVAGAFVRLTNTEGRTLTVLSDQNGVFVFGDVRIGQTYTISVESDLYTFAVLTVNALDRSTSVDLIAEP